MSHKLWIVYIKWYNFFACKFPILVIYSNLLNFLLFRYRQARFSSRRVRKRVVFKHGDCNVVQGNVAKRRRRYLQVLANHQNIIKNITANISYIFKQIFFFSF